MESIKALAIRACYLSGFPRLLANSPETCLTTILFHRFVFAQESIEKARDRLKRQCEWLRKHYTPMTQLSAIHALRIGQLPKRPLLITIDDALIDLLDFEDIFRSFELPISIFACVGWCANDSAADSDTLLARVVAKLEWYNGSKKAVSADGGRLKINLNSAFRNTMIDRILDNKDEWHPYLDSVIAQLSKVAKENNDRKCCNWEELSDLKSSGADIGCHSVSHIRLAEASPTRIDFEIVEAKRILTARFGSCEAFAYPYGMPGTFNQSTTTALKRAGFEIGFLTVAGFADSGTDYFHVPRIALPDQPLEFEEFRARVGGGGVVIAKAREFIRGIPKI